MGILGFLAVILFWIFIGIFGLMAFGFVCGVLINAAFTPTKHDDSNDYKN